MMTISLADGTELVRMNSKAAASFDHASWMNFWRELRSAFPGQSLTAVFTAD